MYRVHQEEEEGGGRWGKAEWGTPWGTVEEGTQWGTAEGGSHQGGQPAKQKIEKWHCLGFNL